MLCKSDKPSIIIIIIKHVEQQCNADNGHPRDVMWRDKTIHAMRSMSNSPWQFVRFWYGRSGGQVKLLWMAIVLRYADRPDA